MVWSVSTHRQFSRCQRQFFFAHCMANARAKDLLRRQAQGLGRIQHIEWWVGDVVHRTIEQWVIPEIKAGGWPNADYIIDKAKDLAQQQFRFSEAHRYRDEDTKKEKNFCILASHYFNQAIAPDTLDEALGKIENSLVGLLCNPSLRGFLQGRSWYRWEQILTFKVDTLTVRAKPDLILPNVQGGLDIVDWKVGSVSSDYPFQVAVYALAIRETKWLAESAPSGVTCYVINLQGADPAKALNSPFNIQYDDLNHTIDLIYESGERIRALTNDLPYEELSIERFEYARSAGTCYYCNWRELCVELGDESPAKRLPAREPEPVQLGLPLD